MKSVFSFLTSIVVVIAPVLFLVLFTASDLYADHKIDSLKTALKLAKTDTASIKIYGQLGERYTKKSLHDSALIYFTKALELSESQKSDKIGRAHV